ncbi:MAG: phage tail protein I [Cetobacterium sp.]
MKTIFNTNLIDLLPISKKNDKETILYLEIAQEILKTHVIENMKFLVSLDRIDTLEEKLVDLLAEELHVDFYDIKSSLTEKRKLVKSSILTHMIKGTPYSINTILNIFFKGARLKEWFEYDGEPGWFKIDISDATITQDIETVLQMIESTKRKSQWIQELIKNGKAELNLNFASGIYTHKEKILIGDFRV